MKICIIGAGIGGLTLALACQRLGWDVCVYEKAKELKTIGGGVLLWPHGQRYLSWLGLEDILAPFHISVQHCSIANAQGEIIFHENYAAINASVGGSILPLDRSRLQQALIAQLKPGTIQLNKACSTVESDTDYALVHFADGSQTKADLIVGADGIHSAVRKYIAPQSKIAYTENYWWGGLIETKYLPNLNVNDTYVAVETGKMCIVWPSVENYFMWYLPVKMPVDGFNTQLTLKNICAHWRGPIQQIIAAPSQQNFQLPIYDIKPQEQWVKNRVVIIGDAAHALGPILGQGASQAIEDVYVLLACLQRSSSVIHALKHYDSLRHDRYERLYELEKDASSMMLSDDPETRAMFENVIPKIDLVTMYQELIPLINEAACLNVVA